MKLYTIGFTKTTAESFFSRLSKAGVKKVVDVRLNNISQLAGFAKKNDLQYFLKAICGIGYEHRPELAHNREAYYLGHVKFSAEAFQTQSELKRHHHAGGKRGNHRNGHALHAECVTLI